MGALAHYVTVMEQFGALGKYPTRRTVGSTWRWDFDGLVDDADNPIPVATIAGFTANCKIYDLNGTVIATPTFTATDDGSWALEVDESSTAGLVLDNGILGRVCQWECSLSDGTDVIQIWTLAHSPFLILPNATV